MAKKRKESARTGGFLFAFLRSPVKPLHFCSLSIHHFFTPYSHLPNQNCPQLEYDEHVKHFHKVEGILMIQMLSNWLWGNEEQEVVPFETKRYVRNEMEQFTFNEPQQVLPYPLPQL
ncbi:hypothetical protein BBR47_22070 [Brevibacillus brevis NBRC 100599]|uniref:Uncharacterized protein n=1 Tax=Brevibacillus brevis (strain 47 / JCM 6285 / NBRC 100599) TaxID=358681 RepID=C0ZBM5_BREBN|nr:hypothetical protein BBR47_22070 [Brevibacillus brevis NBRC 100599]